jgi:signal transduction histidine kinase
MEATGAVASIRRYSYAIVSVTMALAIRLFLVRWTGPGAPFLLLFGAVVLSSFLWGVGPGLLSGIVAAPIAAYLFVYPAGYTVSQAAAQTLVFLVEVSIICVLAARFAQAKRRSELNEQAAREAEAEIRKLQQKEHESHLRIEEANASLQRSEAELREAQRLAHAGNWSWDVKSDSVKWSEEVYRIFGRDPNLPPPPFYSGHAELFTPDSMTRLHAAVERALHYSIPYELDLELIRPDGSRRWIIVRGEPTRDFSGSIAGLYGTAQDITQLKQLQKMREEWTSVIAHDLRQPIGSIVMSADLMPRVHDGEMNEREKSIVARVRLSALNLGRMVDDLLDVSQMEAEHLHLDRRWVDPRTVVGESINRLAHVTSGLLVKVSETDDLSPVFADPARIEQVLGNLLSNAVKYGDRQSEILVRLYQHEDGIAISVTNNGRGISQEEMSRLFNRFTRSKASRSSGMPGLGLGLYIAKGLVEAHGGRIWVESTPGETTTFHFTLPVRVLPEATGRTSQ